MYKLEKPLYHGTSNLVCELNIPCEDCQWYSDGKHFTCDAGKFKPRAKEAIEIQSALHSVLGDDLDGLSAEMEDLGLV